MEFRPGEDEAELAPGKGALHDLEIVDADLGSPSACQAWKCGYSWSSKNIAITIPWKRLLLARRDHAEASRREAGSTASPRPSAQRGANPHLALPTSRREGRGDRE
jgi:hypothetical protein